MEDPVSLSDYEKSPNEDSRASDYARNPEIMMMTVDLGNGMQDVIRVRELDDLLELAKRFSLKHHLDEKLTKSLHSLLRENFAKVKRKAMDLDLSKWNKLFSSQPIRKDLSPPQGMLASGSSSRGLNSAISKSPSSQSIMKSTGMSNYGEYLYARGLLFKERNWKTNMAKKKLKMVQSEKDLTFKPSINKISEILSQRHDHKIEEMLLMEGLRLREKRESERSKAMIEEMTKCTFAPKINGRSAQIDSERHTSRPRHMDLYEDAKRRNTRQEMLTEACFESEFTFTPNLSLTQRPGLRMPSVELAVRLIQSKQEFEQALAKVRNEIQNDLFDYEKGQPFFTPKTGRPPVFDRNAQKLPVGHYLYSINETKQSKLKQKEMLEDISRKVLSECTKSNPYSQKLYDRYRLKIYIKLFNELDSDGDGCISANRISFDSINLDTLDIITPLLIEMEEKGETVRLPEFVQRVENLFSKLSIEERSRLLKKETISEEENSAYQPELNKISLAIAEKRRQVEPEDMYIRQINERRVRNM
jgi:hypothetical protein